MKQFYVYILECADGTYYVGITNNLEGRLFEHQKGISNEAYTFKRRPIKLVFSEAFTDPQQAINFEKQVKGWRREKKEALIRGEWDKLPELSKRYS
ncbi:GIY-YIG nuclease family protein [Pseudopedobacter beijingensis]|uniref:GIY-YIG nuclease family protein n=1 Tax=Pseudopedobacter beijingensis TaxID=1207056 RepID=A0ABW4I7F4_9SPHI